MKVYLKGKIIEYLEHLIAEFMLKTKQKKVDTKPLIPPVSFKYFPSFPLCQISGMVKLSQNL